MASDLSNLIQENICSTLNGLLAKDANVKQLTKSVEQDFSNTQHLKVESTFEFDNITSTWNFLIPAYSSSLIFNSMLGDESEPVTQIDADIADAISEFISNLSGSLTTAINGSEFEDLGQSKFTIGKNEILENIEDINNIYGFDINLEGKDIKVYIQFDNVILPFITQISNSPETVYEEQKEEIEEEVEENSQEEVEIQEEQKDQQQENKESAFLGEENSTENSDISEKETKNEKDNSNEELDDQVTEETQEIKKSKKIKLIIFIVAGLLILTIIAGAVMYFTGMFDPEPVIVEDANKTKMVKKVGDVEVIEYKIQPKTDFDPKEINENRLNSRLAALAKYEIMTDEQIEEQKLAEKERLFRLEKEEELIAFAKKNKEEEIFQSDSSNESVNKTQNNYNKSRTNEDELLPSKQELQEELIQTAKMQIEQNNKLRFILVGSLKFKLYKQLIGKMNTDQARISICKNNNGRTVVYIGPFDNLSSQNKMLNLLQSENILEAAVANLSQEEFDARCNFQ